MTTERIYTTGTKPQNPIVRDDVLYIRDIRREPSPAESPEVNVWSFEPAARYTKEEYLKLLRDEITDLSEAIMEIDSGNGGDE